MRPLLTLIALGALAAMPQTAVASNAHPTLDEVSHQVNCPTCHRPLDQSVGPASDRMRVYITEHIQRGWTTGQIVDGLVSEYGDESVRAAPRTDGVGLVAWAGPVLAFLALIGCGVVLARRWSSRVPVDSESPAPR